MANIINYAERELSDFNRKPFHSVDSLIFSKFSYIGLSSFVPGFVQGKTLPTIGSLLKAEHFREMFCHVWDEENSLRLLFAMAASPRYRNLTLGFYREDMDCILEKQFCAVTVFLDDDTAYIAFRGTDATLVGWKEDFNMAFKYPVPSQEEAVRYVAEVGVKFKGKLILGGHSKGGNLAIYVYAKLNSQLKNRIVKVYSHDGPGFKENAIDLLELEGSDTIVEKTIPQSSVIGMLLENQEQYSIVKSNRTGILQHDPFSWIIEGDHFVFVERLTKNAKYMDRSLHNWLEAVSDEERGRFVNALYSVLDTGNTQNIKQIGAEWQKSIPLMMGRVRNLDDDSRFLIHKMLKTMAVTALKSITENGKD
ncbi:DUF2974 domain-containing protein [Clostridium boliviensis]|uniref:DUF2974 domain-containing protein n=1 Tax=Clostridium boliviensis TaxID=318465 RepID=A0ABU4GT11_9CLOT|nr:DUF2974 domain-containing protein [Clostridium boliviensis]MDW2800746.1 DUF2974 domain-containing protein [Clostridium boliviensis]